MGGYSSRTLSRRAFLRTSGAVVVAFGIPPVLGPWDGAAAAPSGPAVRGAGGIDSWLAIAQDGGVTVFTDKVELGMGVSTAFAQIVAEELDVPVASVSVVMGDTALTPDQGGVGGSTSIS
ncbi:MAG TPA: molybdopterin cofactor-binding domain-containing protein, partial [bacterium]|nr:molybdopterin cofactor-binding domain-containing protein [bacterium]